MDAAFLVGDADASQLATGVADKLRAAAARIGEHVIPSSKKPSTLGRQWRFLAMNAGLSETESNALVNWVDEALGDEAVEGLLATPRSSIICGPSAVMSGGFGAPAPATATAAGAVAEAFASLSTGSAGGGAISAPLPVTGGDTAHAHGPSAPSTQALDEAAHGFDAGTIAFLTFTFHLARTPPPGHDEVRYGVDPSAMAKLYKSYKTAPGTVLWTLVEKDTTTIRDLQDHFHRASQAAQAEHPAVAARISAHWMEMIQYFDSASLMRAYYRKFLTIRRGRGIPELVDRHILLLVMCAEFSGKGGGGDSSEVAALTSTLEKMQKQLETVKELVSEFKIKVGELKSEVNNLKDQMKEAKKKKDMFCSYCGGTNHTEAFCRKKKDDEKSDKKKNKKKDDDDDDDDE